ncbi:MAG: hypothetical protein CPSOU_1998 [uncultured Paraburkholderia sp.]|nr:MAG: hypothetical protein CPSOU_1998 [uncultured Paraburkholderia sp.]
MPIQFSELSTEDLAELKRRRNATGKEMAELFWLGGDHQWRKYTGGQEPRKMSPHMAFLGAARMALTQEEFERVLQMMETFGARVKSEPDGGSGQ